MRKKMETIVSFIAAECGAIFIVYFLLKERELLRLVFGTFLVALVLFGFFIWLFEIAYAREERKNKKRKSIDQLSLE